MRVVAAAGIAAVSVCMLVLSRGIRAWGAAVLPSAVSLRSVSSVSVAMVTAPNASVAEQLAKGLLEQRLAACINEVPRITSSYTWEGKMEREEEVLLIIKTQTKLQKQLTDWVVDAHPYDTPEVIFTDVTGGSQGYLDWVVQSTSPQ